MRSAINLYSLARKFPNEKHALEHLIRTRWPKGVRCVACNHHQCWSIESNHGKELKDRDWTTTQTVENAFSLFKRAIVGNYHKLSPWHLNRYMREFCWRYNRRHQQASIFDMALTSMLNRVPLPYKTLVAF